MLKTEALPTVFTQHPYTGRYKPASKGRLKWVGGNLALDYPVMEGVVDDAGTYRDIGLAEVLSRLDDFEGYRGKSDDTCCCQQVGGSSRNGKNQVGCIFYSGRLVERCRKKLAEKLNHELAGCLSIGAANKPKALQRLFMAFLQSNLILR